MEISKFLKITPQTDETHSEEYISKWYDDLSIFTIPQNNNQTQYNEKTISLTDFFKNIFNKVIIPQNPTIITDEIFENNSIIDHIQKNELREININILCDKYKNEIFEILNQNYPIAEIIKLQPNEKIINTHFSWIKHLNDELSPEFTDKKCNTIKQIIKENITNYSCNHKSLINTYKNFAFSTNCNEINDREFIFWETKTKKELFKKIDEIFPITNFRIVNKSTENIKKIVFNNLKIWVWQSIIKNNHSNVDKLNTIREAELASRNNKNSSILDVKNFNNDEYNKLVEKTALQKKELIKIFLWKNIIINGKKYPIFDKNTNFLSYHTVRFIKKYPELINNSLLKELVEKYLTNLNNCIDFIPPITWKITENNLCFKQGEELNNQKDTWIINTNFILKDYKWWLNKEAFFNIIEWKQWVCVFLDFANIWIENILEYDKILLKYYEIKKLWKDNKTMLLEAWHKVTDSIINIRQLITWIFPNAKISYGWDEFYFFIENIETPEIIKKLWSPILKKHKQARFIFNTSSKYNKKNIFQNLESLTQINKFFERKYNIELYKINKLNKSTETKQNIIFEDEAEEKQEKLEKSITISFWDLKISSIKLCPILEEYINSNKSNEHEFIENINNFIDKNINYIMTHQNHTITKWTTWEFYAIPTNYNHIDLKVTNYWNWTISLFFYFNDNI